MFRHNLKNQPQQKNKPREYYNVERSVKYNSICNYAQTDVQRVKVGTFSCTSNLFRLIRMHT
jgi:uncharacterized membrane protein YgaE (UPF0421/DUF939 family)